MHALTCDALYSINLYIRLFATELLVLFFKNSADLKQNCINSPTISYNFYKSNKKIKVLRKKHKK